MRAIIRGIEIEGTPAEIAELINSVDDVRHQFNLATPNNSASKTLHFHHEEGSTISIELAYRILKRIPLSNMQKAFLSLVKAAHPSWVGATQIQHELSWSGNQLGGVLGGLGRRVSATKGVTSSDSLWVWRWDDNEGEYAYRLPSSSVEALNRLGI